MGDFEDDADDSIDDTEYQNALGTRPDLPDYLDDFLQDDAYEKILGKIGLPLYFHEYIKFHELYSHCVLDKNVFIWIFRYIFCLYIGRSDQ